MNAERTAGKEGSKDQDCLYKESEFYPWALSSWCAKGKQQVHCELIAFLQISAPIALCLQQTMI